LDDIRFVDEVLAEYSCDRWLARLRGTASAGRRRAATRDDLAASGPLTPCGTRFASAVTPSDLLLVVSYYRVNERRRRAVRGTRPASSTAADRIAASAEAETSIAAPPEALSGSPRTVRDGATYEYTTVCSSGDVSSIPRGSPPTGSPDESARPRSGNCLSGKAAPVPAAAIPPPVNKACTQQERVLGLCR
jgi:hypothetical protein